MLIEKITDLVKQNKSVALVSVTSACGSTPAEVGKEMLVDENGIIDGTVGGGQLEYQSIELAKKCLFNQTSKKYSFDLKVDLDMECGGDVEIFIKVYCPATHLVLIGAGHVNKAVYQFSQILGYKTTIIDDRAHVLTKEAFPNATNLILGDIGKETAKLNVYAEDTFVVIASHGHYGDQVAVENMLTKKTKYIGVIGSKFKVKNMIDQLIKKGFTKQDIDKIYAPIGIALGGNRPSDVAMSIISEIVLVKNNGKLRHMKNNK